MERYERRDMERENIRIRKMDFYALHADGRDAKERGWR
jgi:hypothetical protein